MGMFTVQRSRPIGRATNASVGTNGAAFAVPTTAKVYQVKINVGADAYIGIGTSDTVPAASTSNSGYLSSGTETITLDAATGIDAYIYVWAVTGTLTAKISYYG